MDKLESSNSQIKLLVLGGEYGKVWMGFPPKFYPTYHFFVIKKRKKYYCLDVC